MPVRTLAVDFGTSNSAAAMLEAGQVRRIPIEAQADTLPTAVFFPEGGGAMQIGTAAGSALIDGEAGRYMRALKSILGTSLLHEERLIEGRRRSLSAIVTAFLSALKARAEACADTRFDGVLSGRPVHFHSGDAARDAQAETDLRACYEAAGFSEVRFVFEPEAAARASHGLGGPDGIGLIVDIGGGTSDFSLFQTSGGSVEILASHGIRLGGTDFDRDISMTHAMPLLGQGGQLRRTFGEGLLPVPNAIYLDLATWAKIPFLYARDTERAVEDLLRHAVEPEKVARLARVISEELGHELAFSMERAKIAANGAVGPSLADLGFMEPGLEARITTGSLGGALAGFVEPLRGAIYDTLVAGGITPARVDSVILVGGSSLMRLVSDLVGEVFPGATLKRSDAFTAVIDGLAMASGET